MGRAKRTVGKGLKLIVAALATIAVAAACAFTSGHAPGQPMSCQAPFPIGFQVVPFTGGRSMAVWYPSDDAQATFSYSRDIGTTLALNGQPLSSCGRFPPQQGWVPSDGRAC